MVQTENKFLDDLAKLATGAAGTLHGMRQEIEGMIRGRLDRILADLDLVTREEFDVVKAMAAAAREENEALRQRLDALEKAAKGTGAATKRAPARKRTASKTKTSSTKAAPKTGTDAKSQ